MINRYLSLTVIVAVVGVLESAWAVPITSQNLDHFYQLEGTRYACYYNAAKKKGQVGKINADSLSEATKLKKIKKLAKERKRLRSKVAKYRKRLKVVNRAVRRARKKNNNERLIKLVKRQTKLQDKFDEFTLGKKSLKKKAFPVDCANFTPGNPPGNGRVGPGETEACPGQEVTLTIAVSRLKRSDVSGIDLGFSYDATLLTAQDISLSSDMANWDIAYKINSDGTVKVALYSVNNLANNSNLISVRFQVSAQAPAGDIVILMTRADFNESANQSLRNGVVKIKSKGC